MVSLQDKSDEYEYVDTYPRVFSVALKSPSTPRRVRRDCTSFAAVPLLDALSFVICPSCRECRGDVNNRNEERMRRGAPCCVSET